MKKEVAFQIPNPAEIVQTSFKEVYNSNKNTAFYYIRQILNDLDFTTQDESLIHARIFGNHLYVLSFCPELEVGVPKKFMFDDVKKLKISMPGLYETNRQILNIRSSITKKYQDFVKATLIEIPYQLQVFEVTKTLGFGNYKDYFSLFTAYSMLVKKESIIHDELDTLLLEAMLTKDNLSKVSLTRSNIGEYRKKINNSWAKSTMEIKKSHFKENGIIFNNLFEGLIKLSEPKKQAA